MELANEMLRKLLAEEGVNAVFPSLHVNISEIIELESYKALQKIKAIIEDDSLEDDECFTRIEKIVSLFEQMGSDGGNRHDFG